MSTAQLTDLFDIETVVRLYRTYADDLRAAREAQRELRHQYPLKPKLDDIEAELTYLALRAVRPAEVVEIGSFHGWSTTWILRALRDNGSGHLHTFDLVDHATRTVPPALSGERWTFGFDPAELPDYLATRGIALVDDVGACEYRARYLGAAGRGYAFYRAVTARIDPARGDACRK